MRQTFGVRVSASEGDEFLLDRLTDELAADLREVGEVTVPATVAEPDAKGVGETAVAVLTVLASTDPAVLRVLVDTLRGFVNRDSGRRVHLRVGDVELTIDGASHAEGADVIHVLEAAVNRGRP